MHYFISFLLICCVGCHTSSSTLDSVERKEVKARHILLYPMEVGKGDPKLFADSILTKLRTKEAKFEELATKYGCCGSEKRGGDLGWFKKGEMVSEFEQAVFYRLKLNQPDTVRTKFGLHVVELTGIK